MLGSPWTKMRCQGEGGTLRRSIDFGLAWAPSDEERVEGS